MTSILAVKKADRLQEQKRTGSQFDYITPLTLKLVLAFTVINMFFTMKIRGAPKQIPKPAAALT